MSMLGARAALPASIAGLPCLWSTSYNGDPVVMPNEYDIILHAPIDRRNIKVTDALWTADKR
jgi:hypothetical protein